MRQVAGHRWSQHQALPSKNLDLALQRRRSWLQARHPQTLCAWPTSFRVNGRSADVTEAMHDLGWILFMTVIWSLFVQVVAIGVAVLLDRRSDPLLPRWLGYLNIWVAILILPAGTVLFFKDGPLAWNGIVGLYIPLTAFVIWIAATTIVIHKNLTRQIAEAESKPLIVDT